MCAFEKLRAWIGMNNGLRGDEDEFDRAFIVCVSKDRQRGGLMAKVVLLQSHKVAWRQADWAKRWQVARTTESENAENIRSFDMASCARLNQPMQWAFLTLPAILHPFLRPSAWLNTIFALTFGVVVVAFLQKVCQMLAMLGERNGSVNCWFMFWLAYLEYFWSRN